MSHKSPYFLYENISTVKTVRGFRLWIRCSGKEEFVNMVDTKERIICSKELSVQIYTVFSGS